MATASGDDAMGKTMTPSMTDGQFEKAVDIYRSLLRKHRHDFPSETVQYVLGQADYVNELVSVLRKRVETVSNMLVRHVTVDRTRTPQEAITATGRRQYVSDSVVASMPRGEGEEVAVHFFKLSLKDGWISDVELDMEYERRGLVSADPYSLAAVNEADPAFADDHPNATHWKNSNGKYCYAAFRRWIHERYVYVNPHGNYWGDDWWFAGVRK